MEWINLIVYVALAVNWVRAWNRYQLSGKQIDRRRVGQWMWALIGALFGSFTGFVGFGIAIAGTIVGAAFGYLLAGYLYFAGNDPEEAEGLRQTINQGALRAGQATGAAIGLAGLVGGWARRVFRVALKMASVVGVGLIALGVTKTLIGSGTLNPAPADSTVRAVSDPVYDATVSMLEQKYPQLRPGSPSYDQRVVDGVMARAALLQQRGLSKSDAAIKATEGYYADLVGQTRASLKPEPVLRIQAPSRDATSRSARDREHPECEYKAVMADDDYRKCGIPVPDPTRSK